MQLVRIVFLYLIDCIVKVKSEEISSQPVYSRFQNVSVDDERQKLKQTNDTVFEAFKTMNFHRSKMNEFLYRKFLQTNMASKRPANFADKLIENEQKKHTGERTHDAESHAYRTWSVGSKGSDLKEGIYLQNYRRYSPAVDALQIKAKDKDLFKVAASSTDHVSFSQQNNYLHPPIIYKKKRNKIVVSAANKKGVHHQKVLPLSANKLSEDQLKLMGTVLLKNRYFANRLVGEHRPKINELEYTNGGYTNNRPSAEYGGPTYATNAGVDNSQLYITTELPTNALATNTFNNNNNNYLTYESSTIVNRPIYSPNQTSFADFGFVGQVDTPLNSVSYSANPNFNYVMDLSYNAAPVTQTSMKTISPTNQINPMNAITSTNLMNPMNSINSMNTINTMSPANTMNSANSMNFINSASPGMSPNPVISATSGNSMNTIGLISSVPSHDFHLSPISSAPSNDFHFAPGSSSSFFSDDHMPYIIEDHPHTLCACKDGSVVVDDEENSIDAEAAGVNLLDSDMYDAILTTIAFLAFGAYFISMMMKINEKNPSATLMVMENGGIVENGRRLTDANNGDMYLNDLTKLVMQFIEEFHEFIPQLRQDNFTKANHVSGARI